MDKQSLTKDEAVALVWNACGFLNENEEHVILNRNYTSGADIFCLSDDESTHSDYYYEGATLNNHGHVIFVNADTMKKETFTILVQATKKDYDRLLTSRYAKSE